MKKNKNLLKKTFFIATTLTMALASTSYSAEGDIILASGDGTITIPAESADSTIGASLDLTKALTIEEQASQFNFEGQMICGFEGSDLILWDVQLVDASADPNIGKLKEGLAGANIQLLSKVFASESGLIVMNVKTPLKNNNEPSVMVIESAKKDQGPLFYNISSIEGSVIRSKDANYSDLLFKMQPKLDITKDLVK